MIALDVDRPGRAHGLLQQRAEHVGHPVQPLDHLGAVGAVAQHLAEALVERAPRRRGRARRRAARRPTSTARRRRPSGRPRRGGGTARGRPSPAARPASASSGGVGQALEEHRADERAAHRAATRAPSSIGGPACRKVPRSSPSASRRRHARRRGRRSAAVIRSQRQGVGGGSARVAHDAGEVGLGAVQRRLPLRLGRPARPGRAARRRAATTPAVATTGSVGRAGRAARRAPSCQASSRGRRAGRARAGWRRRWTGRPRRRRRRAPRRSAPGPAGRRRCRSARPRPAGPGRRRAATARAERTASASSPAGSGWAPWPSTRSSSSTPQVGSAASRGDPLQPQGGVDHRVGPAAGQPVVAEVDDDVARRRAGRRRGRGRARAGCCCGCRPASRSATIIASSARVPPQNSPRSDPAVTGCLVRRRQRSARSGTAWPSAREDGLDGGGEVGAARAQRRPVDRQCRARRHRPRCRRAPRRPGAWRPRGRSRWPWSAASAASACRVERPATAAERSRPPTPRQWLSPTPAASSRHITCWAPVPEAATMPTEPGRTTLAKPRATPPTMRRAAVGAHDEHVGGGRGVLEPHLVVDGDVVGEQHHAQTRGRWRRRPRSTACWPGTEMSARLASERAAAAPRVRAAAPRRTRAA